MRINILKPNNISRGIALDRVIIPSPTLISSIPAVSPSSQLCEGYNLNSMRPVIPNLNRDFIQYFFAIDDQGKHEIFRELDLSRS